MKYLQKLLILFSLIFGLLFTGLESVSSSFSAYENQIFSESNVEKVRKLQEVFKGLDLYNGNIDGNYKSIENDLLSYQKKVGIIKYNNDHGAGYFGNKTIKALENEYGNKFTKLKEEFLKIDKPYEGDRYFYVTAYYSPLPGQRRYTTGSYRGDIRLNGGGKVTASGKGVYTGILAAPRNYAYGTKIYLDGIGIGAVEDRGGAIVNSGERGFEHDRIDVWMGYGDEGLERALKWGKRKIKGKIVPEYRNVTIEFDRSPVAKYTKLKVDAENPKKENVIKLQNLLKEVGLYNGNIDGNFEKVRKILVKFQVDNNIISGYSSPYAGYYGSKTHAAFRKIFNKGGIFIEKHEKPGDGILLATRKKEELARIKKKIDSFLKKKYKTTALINKKKLKIKNNLTKALKKTKSTRQKNEIRYLTEIL